MMTALSLAGCLLVASGVAAQAAAPPTGAQFFVSPTGSDRNRGTAEAPFLTLGRARSAVRHLCSHGLPPGGVTVWLRGGDYELTASFALTEQDSGSPEAPVVYRAWPGELARLTGGRPVSGWAPVTDPAILARLPEEARAPVRQVDLPAQGITDFGKLTSRGFGRAVSPSHLELFCSGERMTLARWPNEGFTALAGYPSSSAGADDFGTGMGKVEGGFFYEGDRPSRWLNTGDLWAHGYWAYDWANSYENIESLDPQTHLIKTRAPYGLYGFRPGQRVYYLNILEELDQPGEYHLDRQSGKLYFWPPVGSESAPTWVSLLEAPLVTLQGASHVTFRGLLLEYSRGDGVTMEGGTDDLVAGCVLRNLGNRGVIITGGSGCGVAGCDLYDLGDGGIVLSGGDRPTLTPAGHFADNNHIHHYAQWSRCYQAGVNITGVGNRLTHNHIHDAPHNAILLGGNDHLIEYNHLHDVCTESGDAGAFYMGRDWTWRGNLLRYNFIHDVGGVGQGAFAVYFDDCSSGNTVFGNLFWRDKWGVLIGGGRDFRVENNVFVDCHPGVHVDARGLDPHPNWHNMVFDYMKGLLDQIPWQTPPWSERYPELANLLPYYQEGQGIPPEGNVLVRNVNFGGEWLDFSSSATAAMLTLQDNFTQGDPGFVDAAAGNFQLRDDSPVWKLGFQRIPVDQIGLQADEYRASLPPEQTPSP